MSIRDGKALWESVKDWCREIKKILRGAHHSRKIVPNDNLSQLIKVWVHYDEKRLCLEHKKLYASEMIPSMAEVMGIREQFLGQAFEAVVRTWQSHDSLLQPLPQHGNDGIHDSDQGDDSNDDVAAEDDDDDQDGDDGDNEGDVNENEEDEEDNAEDVDALGTLADRLHFDSQDDSGGSSASSESSSDLDEEHQVDYGIKTRMHPESNEALYGPRFRPLHQVVRSKTLLRPSPFHTPAPSPFLKRSREEAGHSGAGIKRHRFSGPQSNNSSLCASLQSRQAHVTPQERAQADKLLEEMLSSQSKGAMRRAVLGSSTGDEQRHHPQEYVLRHNISSMHVWYELPFLVDPAGYTDKRSISDFEFEFRNNL